MQFSHALIALVAASLANAQLPNIPTCALSCFIQSLGGDGCSDLTDFACHCAAPELPGKITPCVAKACEPEAQTSVSNIVVSQCSAAGVPIVLPPIGGGSGSSAAPTGAPTDAPTDAPTNAPTGGATPTPTGAPSASDSQPPSGAPSGTGSYTVPAPSGTGPPEGAGSSLNTNIGGVAAALLAIAAYL
ncbi:hypothetical protein EMCG_07131 [[Emmonsia] crescens]|uniref:CFEM domain-containing protein n=1 Tax=[Emmonsia] crescens TaxID=73230 RepID=A0A0G2JBB4_9EURO|nr:hypothetical protein EMCG_07131 [Emmonsia crescens UAMH 3008]